MPPFHSFLYLLAGFGAGVYLREQYGLFANFSVAAMCLLGLLWMLVTWMKDNAK